MEYNNSLSFKTNTIVGYDPNVNDLIGIYANLNPINMSIGVGNDRMFMYDNVRNAIIKLDLKTQLLSSVYPLDYPTMSILETRNGGILFSDVKGKNIKLLYNNQITIIAGMEVTGYSGDGLANETKLNFPRSLLEDAFGNVYFIDYFNNRVRKLSGNFITTVAGDGKNENSGNKGSAIKASLKNPSSLTLHEHNLYVLCDSAIRRVDLLTNKIYGITVDSPFKIRGIFHSNGSLYLHSASAIGKLQPNSNVAIIAGSESSTGPSENNILAKDAQFRSVTSIGVVLTPENKEIIYICDTLNNDIRVINESNYINLVAGMKSLKRDGSYPAPYFHIDNPSGLIELSNGDLVFSHSQGISKVSNNIVTQVIESQTPILGLAYYEKEDELYFVDSQTSRIQKLKNGEIIHVAGNQQGQISDNILATRAILSSPHGIAIDQRSGDVYLTERSGNRIRKISEGMISTVAGNGQAGDNGDNGNATLALLNSPYGIYYTSNNEIYFADSGNNRIRKIVNGIITTVAGAHVCNAKEGSVLAIETVLRNPTFVYVYPNGDFLITETNSHLVRRVSKGIISTIAGTGISGDGMDGIAALQSALSSPKSVIHSYAMRQVVLLDKSNRIRTLTANCESGYALDSSGAFCIPYCYGFLSNDTNNVCSGKGECSSYNVCDCIFPNGGEQCNIVKCSGILATDVRVCNGRGMCLKDGVCDCGEKYSGIDCAYPMCFGRDSNETGVCGGQGECIDWNTCDCNDKYDGENCMDPTCFGIIGTDPSVCSGRGKCTTPDTCTCQKGASGTVCEVSKEEMEKQTRERIIIIICAVSGAITCLFCCIVWTVSITLFTNGKLKQRMNAERDMERRLLEFEFNDSSVRESVYYNQSNKSYIIPIEQISFVKKIGVGGFSNVYLGKWQQSFVAVKSVGIDDDNADETFEKEVQTLCTLKHPNIITFFGISFSDTRRLLIVEYFEKGSLDKYISALTAQKFKCSLEQKIRYLLHIANGMAYLHSFKPNPIIHRDLKPANILMSENGVCKICDFGLSRSVSYETRSAMTSHIGTFYYCANEMLNGNNKKEFATALDVYSFSIIAWELLFEEANPYDYSNTGKMFFSMEEEVLHRYAKLTPFNVPNLVSQGLRPPIPFNSTESCESWCELFASSEMEHYLIIYQLTDLIKRCWDERPEHRPSFVEIVKTLSQLEDIMIPNED